MEVTLEKVLERIVTINHAWKLSREEFGQDFVATKSLRDTKSSLQATLLREFPDDVYLRVASDSQGHDEIMYSVRLKREQEVNGRIKRDAEHLPQRIAREIFSDAEIEYFLNYESK
ncbi:hypothetical protein VIN01S_22170 [Vibrio inusitatus NBRC 102082]|uniref:Uncharacterized protein n=1 Tax=Vibrio inusitatus NBRC 102082 TaxID=1219070 RepID=A0A4Y3HW57_9VIBR|nr:hypothetical protein [Vibrio inusitatus]GEA51413.1 hypothetical protein VIN01S_22170 [Vibrio inusitatus NBRC 102082]